MISSKERGRAMSRSNHTEAQMIGALKQLETGRTAEDVAREVGVSKHGSFSGRDLGAFISAVYLNYGVREIG
jgi:hypothetical protein